jgi:hypothetical protein
MLSREHILIREHNLITEHMLIREQILSCPQGKGIKLLACS